MFYGRPRTLRRGDSRLRVPPSGALSGRARREQLAGYLAASSNATLPNKDTASADPTPCAAGSAAYAAATATTTSYNALLDAATPGEGDKPEGDHGRLP